MKEILKKIYKYGSMVLYFVQMFISENVDSFKVVATSDKSEDNTKKVDDNKSDFLEM